MLSRRSEQSLLTTASLLILAGVAAAVALIYTRPVMVPFVLSLFIYYLVSPVIDLLRFRMNVPRIPAVIATLVLVLLALTLLGMLITTSITSIVENLGIYRERLAELAERVVVILDRTRLDLGQRQLAEGISTLPLGKWAGRAAGEAFAVLTNTFLVMVFVVYLMVGHNPRLQSNDFFAEVDAKIRRYLGMKFAISATTGLTVGVILAMFGLDLALVFGVFAFLLNFIPNIGSVVATLLPLPMALIQFESAWPVIGVVLFPGLVQVTIGNVVEPLVMGEGLDLHPITILLALIFWGLIWGPAGMLLATPITAVLKIVFARLRITKPISEILAGRMPRELPTFTTEIPAVQGQADPGQ